ncbi:hypothetical protein B0J12DRAFT_89809 [Macrophomina phaseolina]|uniref:Uncharacterized protein n=1 Tax=Macrophomina phaseolina TaxID=35725 RepID=A0ABQ8GBK2_9PEZI|nr:hypothetical protein B0J12DRAFT_89809 [Macrophomina phaseolina]
MREALSLASYPANSNPSASPRRDPFPPSLRISPSSKPPPAPRHLQTRTTSSHLSPPRLTMLAPSIHALSSLFSLLLLSALTQPTLAQSTDTRPCYYPSGQQSTDVPCNSTSDETYCCAAGFICFSNKLCVPDPNGSSAGAPDYNRGSCTDPTWTSSDCPLFCRGTQSDRSGGAAVTNCETGSFCCTSDSTSSTDCCSNSTLIFTLGSGNIQTTIGVAASSTSSTSSASATSSPTSSHSAATTTTGSSPAATSSPAAAAGTADDGSSSGLSSGAKAGIGVGVGVGGAAVLAALGAFWVVRRKKAARQERAQTAPSPQQQLFEADATPMAPVELAGHWQQK